MGHHTDHAICWGDKHLGEFPLIINITYRDKL